MNQPTAVVLAGGIGKRFWPIATDKSLLPFFGKPLIEHTLQTIVRLGIEEIVVIANQRNRKEIAGINLLGARVRIVVQEKPLGMADGLLSASQEISGKSILVINGADVVDESLYHDVLALAQRGIDRIIIPGLEQEEYFPGGYLLVKDEKVAGIVEKPKEGKAPSNLVNLVVHYFQNADDLLKTVRQVKSSHDDVYERSVSLLLEKQGAGLIRYKGPCGFLKYPWHVLETMQLFLGRIKERRISQKATIHPSAFIEGSVVIEDGARVLEHAVIKGPSFISEGVLVGTNTLIVESMIHKNCVIGFLSEVARSYLGEGCWLHQNYIGDTVLEGENYFGAGAVTANFRFDEDHIFSAVQGEKVNTKRAKIGAILGRGARIGVNASLMPGIKIGSQAIVGPGLVQFEDVPSKTRILGREKYRK